MSDSISQTKAQNSYIKYSVSGGPHVWFSRQEQMKNSNRMLYMLVALCRKIFQPRKSTKPNHLRSHITIAFTTSYSKYYLQKRKIRNRYYRIYIFNLTTLTPSCITFVIHYPYRKCSHIVTLQFNHFLVYAIYVL